MTGLKFALRSLWRTPVLSLVVVLSLGLGIGANTAIFSLLHQLLLRSLPVKDPQQLVVLRSPEEFKSAALLPTTPADRMPSSATRSSGSGKNPNGLASLASFRQFGANISYRGQTRNGSVAVVSGEYFSTLGVEAAIGRAIAAEDDRNAGNPVAALGYGYWQDRLGGDRGVLNQPLRVNGQIFTVVGILPKGFTGITFGETPTFMCRSCSSLQ